MGVITSITSSQTLALDTNVFILAYKKGPQGETARQLLEKIREVSPRVFISVIVFEEFLVKVYREGLDKNVGYYEEFLTGGGKIMVVDLNRQVARRAAKIRASYPSMRAPDAIHIASGIESGATLFITADRRLPKKVGKLTIKSL